MKSVANRRVESGGEPVDHDRPRILLETRRILVARRKGVVVGDEKVTVVLVLELYPVLERTVVIAEMQAAVGRIPERTRRGVIAVELKSWPCAFSMT
jgi:hypothetical protein